MKKVLLLLLLTLCSVTLIVCQSENEEYEEMILSDSVSNISISNSNGYGGLNENYFLSLNQEETILGFEEVLKNAKGKKQKDTVKEKPDYDILIHYENGGTHGLHLLLGNVGEECIIMFIGNEEEGYVVSPEDTNKLRKLLGV